MTILAELGLLRSYLWWIQGKPAAFAVCNQHRGYFRYEEIAYCQEFSQFSPGRLMLQQIVEDLLRFNSPSVFDFGGGDAEYKRQFANVESRSGTVWLVPNSFRTGMSLAFIKGGRLTKKFVRSLVSVCGLARKARQWVRRSGAESSSEESVS